MTPCKYLCCYQASAGSSKCYIADVQETTVYTIISHACSSLQEPVAMQVLEYIDEAMPPETPLAFGLHPNAEIGFKLREAERFCANVLCLQPREAGGEGGMSVEEKAKMVRADH